MIDQCAIVYKPTLLDCSERDEQRRSRLANRLAATTRLCHLAFRQGDHGMVQGDGTAIVASEMAKEAD